MAQIDVPPASVPEWAEPAPEIGKAVYRLTHGPEENKHYYHTESPFSGDGRHLVYFRYTPGQDEGEVCVMELATGDICVVGTSTRWSDHTAAVQHWQGGRPRVLYQDQEGEKIVLIAVNCFAFMAVLIVTIRFFSFAGMAVFVFVFVTVMLFIFSGFGADDSVETNS